MNINPVSNTSFKGFIIAKKPENGKTTTFLDNRSREIGPEKFQLAGNKTDNIIACGRYGNATYINSEFIKSIEPDCIYVQNPNFEQAIVDISNKDYNRILAAYTAASKSPELCVTI